MTKSQNTKKDLCITSEQLTEQWKKGELPDGEDYYIKWKDSEVFTATFVDFMGRKMFQRMELEFEELPIEHYLSVLAPVPSYDELQNMNKAVNECMAANIKLVEQNAQLKELLKECREVIKNVDTYYGNYDSTNGYLVINKIDEVLK